MLSGKKIIHVIGDSHTRYYEFVPGVSVHHIGQATAHNLYKLGNSSDSRELLLKVISWMNPKRDILLLVFGEIDARIHIHHQHIKTGRSIDSVISDTICNYGKVIFELRDKGFQVVILGIPPAGFPKDLYKRHEYGSLYERRDISLRFNYLMNEFCESNGLQYIDIQSVSKDKEGVLSKEYSSCDNVHMNSKIIPFIMEKLKKVQ